MKILKLLLIPLILFSTAVQAQEVSYMGIIGKGQALGAKDSNDNVVPVLGIDASNNTFLKARTGKALAFGNTAITGTLSVSGITTQTGDLNFKGGLVQDALATNGLVIQKSLTGIQGIGAIQTSLRPGVGGTVAFTRTSDATRIFYTDGVDFFSDATNGGNLVFAGSGDTISMQEATPATACMGVSTPNGTTPVAVTTSCATSGARVFFTRVGAVTNMASVSTTTAPSGSGFSFASTGASDTLASSVVWHIIKESA